MPEANLTGHVSRTWIIYTALLAIAPFSMLTLAAVAYHQGRKHHGIGRYWGLRIMGIGVLATYVWNNILEMQGRSYGPLADASVWTLWLVLMAVQLGILTLFGYLGERSGRKRALLLQTQDTEG